MCCCIWKLAKDELFGRQVKCWALPWPLTANAGIYLSWTSQANTKEIQTLRSALQEKGAALTDAQDALLAAEKAHQQAVNSSKARLEAQRSLHQKEGGHLKALLVGAWGGPESMAVGAADPRSA